MTQLRFGPTQGEGVAIIDKTGAGPIIPSSIGTTAMVGLLERGDTSTFIECSSLADLKRKTGGLIPEGYVPDCAQDFWQLSEGAGRLLLKRITDGNEVKATLTLYGRQSTRQAVLRLDAKNGGGWGGRRQAWVMDLADVATDITETTVKLPIAFSVKKNQLKGGTIFLTGSSGGNGDTWTIKSNNASDGSTKTTVTLEDDATADTNFAAATDPEVIISVPSQNAWGQARHLAAEVLDGRENPNTEWGLNIYLNDELVLAYSDLSSDPTSSRYFVDVINEDTSNHYITATDLWTGAVAATMRPANFYAAAVPQANITATAINLADKVLIADSSNAGGNSIGSFTYGAQMIADRLKMTYDSGGTNWVITSLDQMALHTFPDATGGSAYSADNNRSFGFTITESSPSNGQYFTVRALPLQEDEAIGGKIFLPGLAGAPAAGFPITDNTETGVTSSNYDLTVGATIPSTQAVRLQYKQQFGFGYDGVALVADSHFLDAYDVANSVFNDTVDKGFGLIKFSTPGVTALSGINSVTVEKAGMSYATAKNHQYRYEIPSSTTDEFSARDRVHTTLGRNQRAKVSFPSWAYVSDPVRRGREKLIPTTGMIQGREAKFARDGKGYQSVAAGKTATLPRITRLPVGIDDRTMDREILNPAGIQGIVKKGGNWVHWGGRCPTDNSSYTQAHQRELMSHYGHTLQEAVDDGLFSTSDPLLDIVAQIKSFFRTEWKNGALQGATLDEAVIIKADSDNNTAATRALGDINIEVQPWLVDMTERINITLNKAGAFENEAL